MFLLYGAGNHGKGFIRKCEEVGITDLMVVDSNPELWGKCICDKKIIKFDDVPSEKIVSVAVTTDYKFFE